MRHWSELGALAFVAIWLGGCSCSDKNNSVGGAGGDTGGGGTGGTVTGGAGGTGGDTGGTVTGGTGGTPGGAGGTGGNGGTGGTGGTPPLPPAYCETDAAAAAASALPFNVADAYTYLNQIGPTVTDMDFAILSGAELNCNEVYVPSASAGDAGASDAGDAGDAATVSDSGAPVSDASIFDASILDASLRDGGQVDSGDASSAACFGFHYIPTALYAGVIFQTNNVEMGGGSGPGLCVAPGATMITFWARADRTTEMKFGSTRPGIGTSEFWIVVTPDWTEYSIPVPADYNAGSTNPGGAWNLFSIVAVPANNAEPTAGMGVGEAKIYVKDIIWN